MAVPTTVPGTLTAVLFDVDGTLLDTRDYIYGAFDEALRAVGAPPRSERDYAAIVGAPLPACYETLAPGYDTAALCEIHRAWQVAHMALVRPMPGVASVLEWLRARDVRVAAVTNRSSRSSLSSLRHAGLLHFLATVVSSEDVARQKPDPEMVRLALSRLGSPAGSALLVGDTVADVEAGRAAGVWTIGVRFGLAGDAIEQTAPNLIVDSFDELAAWMAATWFRTA